MKRSVWTGRRSASLVEITLPGMNRFGGAAPPETFYVEPEHEAELRDFHSFALRNGKRFLYLVVGFSVLATAGALLGAIWEEALWACVMATGALGATIFVYPFATPETVGLLGLRRSRTVARLGGVLLLLLAVWLAFTVGTAR